MKFDKLIKLCGKQKAVHTTAFCLLFKCRMREEAKHIKFRNKTKMKKNECESMLRKHSPMTTGIYVLRRKPPSLALRTMPVAEESLLFCKKSQSYTATNVEIAEGNIQHIRFNIEENKETERIVWVKLEVKYRNQAFYAIPVLIRRGQKVGVIFIDCEHIPGTRLCDLRDLNIELVLKARTSFHKRHKESLLYKPNTFNLEVAVVDAHIETSILQPPTSEHFQYCCAACVRTVNQIDCNAYLHLYQNGQRCFHACLPLGLSLRQQQHMQQIYKQECVSGMNRWSGTCKFISKRTSDN
jgi:hypothetical protein